MVAIKQQIVKRTNRISAGKNLINYITIHETANTVPGANAQSHANLQSNGNPRQASWHYQVDDKQIIQSYLDTARCWHAGGNGNYQSIGIEICVNADGDFAKAVENAVKLVKILMARYNLNDTRVVQHNFWTGKDCPRFLRNGSKGVNWNQFKNMINSGTSTSSTKPTINYSKSYLKNIQSMLNQVGFKLGVTGELNKSTINAIQIFQRRTGLEVDGNAGPLTKAKLEELTINNNKQEKDVDEMAHQLPQTQKKDMKKLLTKAYKDKVFHEDHTSKVDKMTRGEATDLLISYVARTAK